MKNEQEAFFLAGQATGARLILVTGGARSGKSTWAEKLAASERRQVAFIATATAGDAEMRERIARHQTERPREWLTLEEPLDLADAVQRAAGLADVFVLDCMTLWTSNWLLHTEAEGLETYEANAQSALNEIEALLAVLRTLPAHKLLIVVTNEVGLGLVPEYQLGRVYRDTLGYVNQRLARAAERVYLLIAGLAVDLKRLQEEIGT